MRSAPFATALLLLLACGQAPAPGPSPQRFFRAERPVPGRYIVVFRSPPAPASRGAPLFARPGTIPLALAKARLYEAKVTQLFGRTLRGFAAEMTEERARALAEDPDVAFVEEDGEVQALELQFEPPWGLDRIDQPEGLDKTYEYSLTGEGVHAYVIDTGIRVTHTEFGDRATEDFSAVRDGRGAGDCNGHGTHVAGTIGGTISGVAKKVRLHAVRVLDCGGRGATSQVIEGIEWVTQHHEKPAVANMSLGGPLSAALDLAVIGSIAAGVVYVVAGGNEATDACIRSPANVPEALTVGALSPPTSGPELMASFSNRGPCIDLFAPGERIRSAWNDGDASFEELNGTSMASPHVAGAAALYLQANPLAAPSQVAQALLDNTSLGPTNVPVNTTRDSLCTTFLSVGGEGPTVNLTSPTAGQLVSGEVRLAAEAASEEGVSEVQFRIDRRLVASVTEPPFEATWDSASVGNGEHEVSATAFCTNRRATSSRVTVRVSNSGGAELHPQLSVPACQIVAQRCFTNTLLVGRGPSESGAPNTLARRCADGDGDMLSNASIESIHLAPVDGGVLASGKEVRIQVAWLASSSSDTLDLFTADDAFAPAWIHRGTASAPDWGEATSSFHYTLTDGPLQAVRLAYRSAYRTDPIAEEHAICSLDDYDDRDDLVFAVGDGYADAQAPAVVVVGPERADSGTDTLLQAYATDNHEVRRVAFEVDGAYVGDDLKAPWEVPWRAPAAGESVVIARAFDAAGNAGASTPFIVQVGDGVPPLVELLSPFSESLFGSLAYVRGDVLVRASAQDEAGVVARVDFVVDDAVVASDLEAPFETTLATDGLAEGPHRVIARATDLAGNVGASQESTLFVDRTPPEVSILSPSADAVVAGLVRVTVSLSEAGAVLGRSLLVDGEPVAWSGASTWDARYRTGRRQLTVRVFDAAGNISDATVGVWVADLEAPRVGLSLEGAPEGNVVGRSTRVFASAIDNVRTQRLDLLIDGLLVASSPEGLVTFHWQTLAAEGQHLVLARAVDYSGNVGTQVLSVEVDLTPPSAAFVRPPEPGAHLQGAVPFEISVSDAHAVSSVELLCDGRAVHQVSAPFERFEWDTRLIPSGEHRIALRATDAVGNVGRSPEIPVEVEAPEAAVFDPMLGTPVCNHVASACRTVLFAGVGDHEQHTPNVLGGECQEWNVYDQSVEELQVEAIDGGALTAGKPARVRAIVRGYEGANVQMFAATNALLPMWSQVHFSPLPSNGPVQVEATFTLGSAGLQAIRTTVAGGLGSVCSANGDTDDLAFAVGP